jgi:type I restriction enzyme S subunit
LNFETARQIELDAVEKQENSFCIKNGDILFCKVGTLGEPKIIKPKGRFALSATLVLIQTKKPFSNVFVRYALDSNSINSQTNYFGSGSTQTSIRY